MYKKRDAVELDDYDIDSIKALYKFMVDSLTKKLKLFSSVRSTKGADRFKINYVLNQDMIIKYDKLIDIMTSSRHSIVYEEDC